MDQKKKELILLQTYLIALNDQKKVKSRAKLEGAAALALALLFLGLSAGILLVFL